MQFVFHDGYQHLIDNLKMMDLAFYEFINVRVK